MAPTPAKKILLCVDDSDSAHNAFHLVAKIMDRENDELEIFCVARRISKHILTLHPLVNEEQINKKIEQHLKEVLVKYAAEAEKFKIKLYRVRLKTGDVQVQIEKEITKFQPQLVVFGHRHDHSWLETAGVGSIAEWAAASIQAPVLIAKNCRNVPYN